jgi:hypothetical protein
MRKSLLLGTLLAGTLLAGSASAQTPPALCNGVCLLTGGQAGDYYQYFADPILALLQKAWVDTYKAESPGAPASLAWVESHQTSYAIVQGDVLARALQDPATASKIKVVRSNGIGNEAVLAIMNQRTFERSSGSWGVVALHAKQVRIATGAKDSGSGATLLALQALDPDNLGKAEITYYKNIDLAIDAVASGLQDVALMVQFPNPDNPRFEKIKEAHLHFAPVLSGSMKKLTFPDGKPAYSICENVTTGIEKVTTACTPINLVTGASNDNIDLERVFTSAPDSAFAPKQSGFAKFWSAMKTVAANTTAATFDAADKLAKTVSDKM